MRRGGAIVLVLAALALSSCAARLPTYPALDAGESLVLIAERMESVRTVSASARVTLVDASGESVTLDAALAARPPSHARLRAWKFGSPVLDLTITPEGVWVYSARRDGAADPLDAGALPAESLAGAVEALSGAYFRAARVEEGLSDARTLTATGPAFGVDDALCEIDRATLTARRFVFAPGSSDEAELRLDRYTLIGGAVWPRRWVFVSPQGRIVIRLADVELNAEPPAAAFTPPARATRRP